MVNSGKLILTTGQNLTDMCHVPYITIYYQAIVWDHLLLFLFLPLIMAILMKMDKI